MRIALVMVVIGALAAGCSKKSAPAAGDQSAAPAAPAASAAAPASPTAAAPSAACAACQQYDACCTALLADGSGDVEKSDCDGRAASCASTAASMQGDMNDTCKQRVADWHTAHPDVPACK